MPETNEAWCPWCRRWIYPVQHIGPGHFCPHCHEHLGINISKVMAMRPAIGHTIPIPEEKPQPELAFA